MSRRPAPTPSEAHRAALAAELDYWRDRLADVQRQARLVAAVCQAKESELLAAANGYVAPKPEQMRPKAAAALFGVSVRTLRRWQTEGRLPYRRIGKRSVAYRLADLEAQFGGEP